MEQLRNQTWFEEAWAAEVQKRMRYLVCAYVEVCEAVQRLPATVQFVRLGGIGMRRPLVLIKSLLRDVVEAHVDTVLSHTTLLMLRAYRAARPYHEETWLGVTKHASPESRANAEAKRAEFLEKQKRVAALLETAAGDAEELRKRLGGKGEGGAKVFKAILHGIRRLLPLLWATWVAAVLSSRLAQSDALQFVVFAVGAIIVYHVLALAGLPFHDAGERKHALFGMSLGSPSDGLPAVCPPLARLEDDLFKLFAARRPVVMTWEDLVPLLHYVAASAFIAYAAWMLPLNGPARMVVWIAAAVLVLIYLIRLFFWWRLIRLRHTGRSPSTLVWAVVANIQALDLLVPPERPEGAEPTED